MDLKDLRVEIDAIDTDIIALLEKRITVADKVAQYKEANNLPVLDAIRERQKLHDLTDSCEGSMKSYVRSLYSVIFDISRDHQLKKMGQTTKSITTIQTAIKDTPQLFPEEADIMCQGTWGSYSQQACDKMFQTPKILFVKTFEGVFSAIEKGLCKYGILPLENSTAGSVNQVYDLMHQYNFHIVRSARVKIDHNLLVKKGVKKEAIKEIISHEQAIAQCENYLKQFPNLKITVCENTALAAEMVSKSDRDDLAALSSSECINLYNLQCIDASVQDSGNNYTRFICIAKNLEIYPGADKTSLMMKVSHQPGSLYKILSRFFLLGINLSKLESRPVADRDFEFMFYFDIDTSVYSESFLQLMSELNTISEDFRYLGSYLEII